MLRWLEGGYDRQLQIALFLLAIALWCVTHPYGGMFEHDARVYTLLVWHWLSPEAYARDPFFLFGSQDRFSAFTPIYGALARIVGLPNAAMAVSALGGLLWVTAAMLVARSLLGDRRLQVFAVLCCVMWSLNYSPNGAIFHLNEAFPTARSLAYALGALALGMGMQQRFWTAMMLAAAASALHPLLGIWPLALLVAQRITDRLVVVAVLFSAALLLALHLSGVGALQRMDPAWESIIRSSTIDVFVGAGTARINQTLAWLSLLLWAGWLAGEPQRRWYQLGAVVGGSGFLLAQLASYYYPAILLIQSQSWRAMWIVVFLGVFALAQVLGVAWRSAYRIWWVVAGLLLIVANDWAGYILFGSCVLLHEPLRLHAVVIAKRMHGRAGRFAPLLLAGLLLVVLPGYIVDLEILGVSLARDFQTGIPILDGLLLAGGYGLGPLLLVAALNSGLTGRVLMAGSALLLLFAVLHWDQRLDKYRAWENMQTKSAAPLFNGVIRRGDVVLWPGSQPQRVWHELGTANYGSSDQAIGGIFSREKTFELLRRRQRLAVASLAETWPLSPAAESVLLYQYRRLTGMSLDEKGNLNDSYKEIKLTGPGMLYACEDPALDWVISDKPLVQDVLAPVPEPSVQKAWLYSCAQLRIAQRVAATGALPRPTIPAAGR
jgi:hypothetical protein